MLTGWQAYLAKTCGLLIAGTLIGWLYGYPLLGLLIAALLTLAWQLRMVIAFESALRTKNFEEFRFGEGIWQQIYSRFRHQKNRSRKYKQRYRKLLREIQDSTNALPDGGIVLNAAFEVFIANKSANALVGIHSKKDRGQRVDNILRDPKFIKYLSGMDFASGVEIRSPIKQDNWLFCRLVPYGAKQHLLLIRDITERFKLTTTRREFIANASHELRSPLTVISGYLDSLAEDPGIGDEWRRPIEQMRSQANRMTTIVAELLELSRLENTLAASSNTPVDVAALVASAKKHYVGIENTANITVHIDTQVNISGNSSEIESVIANLLSNAIRHTPADSSVRLSWKRDEFGAALTVSDSGVGIAEEHLPRLTERFFRVDSGRSRDDGGVGLGLAIVKHALVRHDATLEINSTLNVGSEFICRFPESRFIGEFE